MLTPSNGQCDTPTGCLARMGAATLMASQWHFAKIQRFNATSPTMSNVSIDADIKAKWQQGQCSYSPGSPEELAIIGIDLLVKELGTEAAKAFTDQVFEKYGLPVKAT
jgi:hypothetical protein